MLALDTYLPHGPGAALSGVVDFLEALNPPGPDGIVVHSGLLCHLPEHLLNRWPWIIKLTTNSRAQGNRRTLVDTPKRAVRMGASAVVLNLFIGSPDEQEQFGWMRDISEACDQTGLPLLVFASPHPQSMDRDALAYAARAALELGADMVKTDYPGTPEEFAQVTSECPCPILVEESPLPENEEGTLETVRGCLKGGGNGIVFGRRIWQHSSPGDLASTIANLIHGNRL